MKVEQIYKLMNTVTGEILGVQNPDGGTSNAFIVEEDLSNVVNLGKAIFDATSVDNYVRTLVDVIGRVKIVDRIYSGATPSLLKDGWEYGSVMEKITITTLPEAEVNESWQLTDGASYDSAVFKAPKVQAKFFNTKLTLEVDMSFTDKQVRESFLSADKLNSFISAIYTAVDNSLTVKLDGLMERCINNMIAETFLADYGSALPGTKSGVKAVNLLYLYNNTVNYGQTPLTAAKAIYTPEFIRFAAYQIKMYQARLNKMSSLFNVSGLPRFTPSDKMHLIMLSHFADAAKIYLQSDTYNDEFVALPGSEIVPYWQGSGSSFDYADCSKIKVEVASGSSTADVELAGIIGVMFDDDAAMVANLDKRSTTHYSAKGEFTNIFWKNDVSLFNDLDENFVVFFISDTTA